MQETRELGAAEQRHEVWAGIADRLETDTQKAQEREELTAAREAAEARRIALEKEQRQT